MWSTILLVKSCVQCAHNGELGETVSCSSLKTCMADLDFAPLGQCYFTAPSGAAAGQGPQVTRVNFFTMYRQKHIVCYRDFLRLMTPTFTV